MQSLPHIIEQNRRAVARHEERCAQQQAEEDRAAEGAEIDAQVDAVWAKIDSGEWLLSEADTCVAVYADRGATIVLYFYLHDGKVTTSAANHDQAVIGWTALPAFWHSRCARKTAELDTESEATQ